MKKVQGCKKSIYLINNSNLEFRILILVEKKAINKNISIFLEFFNNDFIKYDIIMYID